MENFIDIWTVNNSYDSIINVEYTNSVVHALKLKKYLLSDLSEKGINYNDYNSHVGSTDNSENPPLEIYEYQPFFLLKRKDDTYVLLDGFRRLIWYNTPDCNINVRIYDESLLTEHQIMKLMVYFNHTKFYGRIGKYYDRGFALGMKTIFDLDILKYSAVFESYLSKNKTTKDYFGEDITPDTEIKRVKERMLNPFFVSDMKFIEKLFETPVMLNDVFGTLVFKYRTDFPDKEFNFDFFMSKVNENNFIVDLHSKFEKNGDGHSEKQKTIINELIKFYTNIFNEMFGRETIKTYTEIYNETKAIVDELRKDKSLLKITGYQKDYIVEMIFEKRLKEKTPINFKCVIYPQKFDREETVKLKPGLVEDEIKILKFSIEMWKRKLDIGFVHNGVDFTVLNFSSYMHKSPKFKKISGTYPNNSEYNIELFVDITKEEIEWMDKNRNY